MTTLDSSKEIQKNNSEDNEKHEDFRMFGLITFLIADGMTFAGFFAAYLTYKAVNPLPDGAIYEFRAPNTYTKIQFYYLSVVQLSIRQVKHF